MRDPPWGRAGRRGEVQVHMRKANAVDAAPKVGTADETGPQAVVHGVDRLMQARGYSLPRKDALPLVPRGYLPPSPEERRRLLRPLDEDLVAEALIALGDLAALGPKALADDLGPVAKDIGGPAATAGELRATDELLAQAERYVEFLRTRRAIAGSDAVKTIEAVADEVNHRAKRDPAIRDRYAAVQKVVDARAAKISEGMAAAKAAKKPA